MTHADLTEETEMVLSAMEQRFLWHEYGWMNAAAALDGDGSRSLGAAGPDRARFDSDSRGIHYVWPDERDQWRGDQRKANGWLKALDRPHILTWKQIKAHVATQPALRDELHAAREADRIEHHQNWETMTAINNITWHRDCTDEQRSHLDAEVRRHDQARATHHARIKAVVAALLPHCDVPLREWRTWTEPTVAELVYCLRTPGACPSTDTGHHCGLKPGHLETFHICPCYWRWPA